MFRVYFKRIVIVFLVVIILIFTIFTHIVLIKHESTKGLKSKVMPTSNFLINSPKCKIINLNPFDMSILQFVQKAERTICAVHPPMTTVFYNTSAEKHTVEVDKSAIRYYTNSSHIRCCVKRLLGSVLQIVFGPCQLFHDAFVMDTVSQFVFVFCLDDNGTIIYQNMHAGIIKVTKSPAGREINSNKLNVILLGFDSMSRLNFYRTMPKTASYLHTRRWVEMRGYNKIADNTLPNMMAFLSGLPPEIFRRSQTLNFDQMPFIWKEFSQAGYVTAYAEDQPLVSTFHCHLSGFEYLPTDHYFRDYMYAGETLLMGGGRPPGCIGYKLASEHVFDYLIDFVTVYKSDLFFGLFWVNQISHNNLNRASGEDDHVLQLLQRLRQSGAMNTTMVVLLSDHGLRVGDFRRSNHGWYEDRLPLFFISVPEWYKAQNPLHFSNLLSNSGRLTSPYDLFLTMKHVLYRRSSVAVGCASCVSLLTPVPPDRSCAQAGISSHWCTCFPTFDVPHSHYSPALANSVVDAINGKLSHDHDINPYFQCQKLTLKTIMYVRGKNKPGSRELIVGIATEPGGAEFEATVEVRDGDYIVEDSISRLNSYGNESSCADNPSSKLFCHCEPVGMSSLSTSSSDRVLGV